MTIQANLDLYAAATNRGALLPRVFNLLATSDNDKARILTAIWHDMRYDILRGDFLRLDASSTGKFDYGEVPIEIEALVAELTSYDY